MGKIIVWESNDVKLLEIAIDNNRKFDNNVSNICSKADRKRRVLTRVVKFLLIKKKRILFKTFIESQFKYCPLVWRFYERQINDKINKLYERTLRVVYNNATTSIEKLVKNETFTIHHQNIQWLVIEMMKL